MAASDDAKNTTHTDLQPALQQSKIRKLRLMQAAVAEAMKQQSKQKKK